MKAEEQPKNGGIKLQIETYNQFGEFYFYVTQKILQEYLDTQAWGIRANDFLENYSMQESRSLFDWLKSNQTQSTADHEEKSG